MNRSPDNPDRPRLHADEPGAYALLFDSIREGIAHYAGVYLDGRLVDLRVLEINAAGAAISGTPREAQIGRTWREIWPAVDPELFEFYRQVDVAGVAVRFEHCSPITGRWYDVSISRVRSGEFGVIFSDTTERKSAAAAARLRENDLAEAQRLTRTGHWSFDLQTGVVEWSDELFRLFGVPAEEFGGLYESFLGRVHPDDRPRVLEANRIAREAGTSFQLDYRIIRNDGAIRVIREVGQTTCDDRGRVVRVFGAAQDVTALRADR